MFVEIGRYLINLDLVTYVEKYGGESGPPSSIGVFFAGSSERALTLDGAQAEIDALPQEPHQEMIGPATRC